MQIVLSAESVYGDDIVLPFAYQELFQAVIYHFNRDLAFGKFLHDEGYVVGNRVFRLFSFSNMLQHPKKVLYRQHKFIFPAQISWIVSTVENPMMDAIMQAVICAQPFWLGKNKMHFTGMKILSENLDNPVRVCTKSPICAYSTVIMPNGKRRTIYYHPAEEEFSQILKSNLEQKYYAFYHKYPNDTEFSISIKSRPRERVTEYKRFVIKGWLAELELSGSQELIQMAFRAGLGGKNAQGFGLVVPKSQEKELK